MRGAALSLALIMAPAMAHAENTAGTSTTEDTQETEQSPFVGRYNGSSFETAMGMIIRADGTFEWGVSVGALDMRAAGTWRHEGDFILFTSDPVPVQPEFGWLGFESVPDGGPLVKVNWASNLRPFPYADVRLTCANGAEFYDQIPEEGWSPPAGECDAPQDLQLTQSIYNVTSPIYDLAETFALEPGDTILFEFRRNDMGVADFTGMSGLLENGILKISGGEWPLELRKVVAE